ncbi:MAG TPA: (Fe-S)-binding protein [Thermodesulfovibrionales bacterium]|nr:(Fe-S)-binding protein [Thermodesulfovibrionales bacterium]
MPTSAYLSDLTKCVRCGSCKAFCPTYEEGMRETMTARGRLRLLRGLLTEEIRPSPALNERLFSCMLCGLCETLCPLQIDIIGAFYHGRKVLRDQDPGRKYLRLLTRLSLHRPALSYRIARMLQHLVNPSVLERAGIPFSVTLPPHPLRDDQQVYKPEKKIGRVAFFAGCSTNYLFPHLGASLINVLLRLGYEVVLPKGEACCGVPLRSLGLEEEAVEMAKKNYALFSRLNTEAVLSLCPTCVSALKVDYPKLIGVSLDKVMDVTTFLADRLDLIQPRQGASFTSVTYHDPCHLAYSLGVRREPRELIRRSGVEFIEAGGEGCCGFGGLFSVQYPKISGDLLKKRSDAYRETGADAVITACPGCMLQLGKGMEDKRVFHIIELLEEALC